MKSLAELLPDDGPVAWLPKDLSDVAILAGATLGPIPFRIPQTRRVTGLRILPRSGDPSDCAFLRVRMIDELGVDRFYDTAGQTTNAPALALSGLMATMLSLDGLAQKMTARPFALDVIAKQGTVWNFSITNNAAITVTPVVVLYHEAVR